MLSPTKYENNLIVHGFCSPSHSNGGEGDMKICQNFVLKNFCLHLRQDKSLWVELKTNGGGCNIYYSITTISLFHFIRNSQHLEK